MFRSFAVFVFLSHFAFIHAIPFQNQPTLLARESPSHLTPAYPSVRRDDVSFTYQSAATHGNVTIADPYNYLEHTPTNSKEVQTFIDQQRTFFKDYTKNFKDLNAICSSIKEASHYDELGFPEAFGNKDSPLYAYHHKELGSDTKVFYIANQAQMDQAFTTKFNPLPGKKVLDEASFDKDKAPFLPKISPDGKMFYYFVKTKATDDLATVYLRNISNIFSDSDTSSLKDSNEVITGISNWADGWTSDSKGFFYQRNDVSYSDSTGSIFYHKLGSSVQDDIIVSKANKDSKQILDFELSDDKKFILISLYDEGSSKACIYAANLDRPINANMKWFSIVPKADLELEYVTNLDNEFYFIARYDNESNEVIKYIVDTNKARQVEKFNELTEKAVLKPTVIPEDKSALIERFTVFDKDKMFLAYTQDARRTFYIYVLTTGKRVQHVLPENEGSSSSITSLSTGSSIFLWSWTFNTPGQIYHIKWNKDQNSANADLVYQAKLQNIDSSQFAIDLKWATSKDSTKVPFHLFYRKGIKFDGTRPAKINFFGAFRVILLPFYSPSYMTWVKDYDAVFVIAYPRGGGEVKAEQWHQAGTLGKKQNTIDDINEVIQYLIDNKITAKGKIVLSSQAAGGVNAMIVANQETEGTIGAVVMEETMFGYGRYDLLRFNTIQGSEEYVEEYGNPQDPKAFDWLRKLSPLHNVEKNKLYPAILMLPGNDSDQSWPARKMIAELQNDLPNNPNPFFISYPDPAFTDDENAKEKSALAIAFATHVLNLTRM